MRAAWLLLPLLLLGCGAPPPIPQRYPTRAGAYATAADLADPAELAWLSGFATVEAGDLWDGPGAYAGLARKGVRLLGYEWMPAAYHYTDGEPDPPHAAWLYRNRAWASLNPKGPYPHCRAMGYDWCQDYYYDYGDERTRAGRVARLERALAGWGGVFLDWGPGVFIDEPAYRPLKETFAARHPGEDYLEAVGRFYRDLRKALGRDRRVVSNQGFRNPDRVLPQVNLDMTESYAVGEAYLGRRLRLVGRGEVEVPDTLYYPVSSDFRRGRLEDSLDWLKELDKLGRKYGGPAFSGFVYMNYAAPRFVPLGDGTYRAEMPKNAILFGYALPMLKGIPAYTEVPFDRRLERLPVYQADLGRPLGNDYRQQEGVYLRFYERGLVLVGELPGPTVLRLRSPRIRAGRLYDFYTGSWIRADEGALAWRLVPEPDPVTGRPAPVGRVLVYGE